MCPIRRRCRRLIREIGVPATTDLPGMCGLVARRVQRPVHLVPMSLDGVVSGMTAAMDDGYWVFYESRTSPWHQAHIVLHELSRLLLGHRQDDAPDAHGSGLAPRLTPHHSYDDATERETEVLGTLLMAHVVPAASDPGPPLVGRAAELAAALGPALRHVRDERHRQGQEERGAHGGGNRV